MTKPEVKLSINQTFSNKQGRVIEIKSIAGDYLRYNITGAVAISNGAKQCTVAAFKSYIAKAKYQ